MSYKETLVNISLPSEADYSADQYTFVVMNSSGRAVQIGAGLEADGVLQNKPNAQGRPATIGINGVSKVVAGAAVSVGDLIAADANGEAVTATTGDFVLGRALEAAGGQGEVIAVLLHLSSHVVIA